MVLTKAFKACDEMIVGGHEKLPGDGHETARSRS
jgi:hypothetical protein